MRNKWRLRKGRLKRWVRAPLRVAGWIALLPERWPLAVLVGLFAMTVLVDMFDSFGVDDVFDSAGSNLIDSILGPMYGRMPGQRRTGQEQIAVVLIDDRTLAENGQDGLPLSYDAQARLLRQVATFGPRAILFDVHYPRPRVARRSELLFSAMRGQAGAPDPEVQNLAQTYQYISRNIPVFIGPIGRGPENAALAPLAQLAEAGLSPTGQVRSYASGLHEVLLDVDNSDVRKYPAPAEEADSEHEPTAPNETKREAETVQAPDQSMAAAFQLYRAFCDTARDRKDEACLSTIPDMSKRSMVVRWGFGVSSWYAQQLPQQVSERCRTGFWNFVLRGATRSIWTNRDDDRRIGEQCGYHDVVVLANINALDNSPTPKPLGEHLRGKIVLIGFDVPSSGDRRVVPFYGGVPGVLTHAMALDNLIQLQGMFMTPEPLLLGLDELDVIQYLGAFSVIILFVVFNRHVRILLTRRDTIEQQKTLIGGMCATVMAAIWLGVAVWGQHRNWPAYSIVFGGILPGGVLGAVLVMLVRKGSKGGRKDGKIKT